LTTTAREVLWGVGESKLEPVTVTVGVATSDEASSADALVRLADERLYRGKHAGRNCVFGEKVSKSSESLPPPPPSATP
jgi:GGDEF domain-containing protein